MRILLAFDWILVPRDSASNRFELNAVALHKGISASEPEAVATGPRLNLHGLTILNTESLAGRYRSRF
jgi:hypothetical protein